MAETCALPKARTASGERRGARWMAASFLLCPCHLPVTLTVIGLVAGGTALGSFVHGHAIVVGLTTTSLWFAGTWRGFRLVRAANKAVALARTTDRPRDDHRPEPRVSARISR